MLTPEERHSKDLIDGLREDIRALARSLDEHARALEGTKTSREATDEQAEEAHIRAIVLEEMKGERNRAESNSKQKKWSSLEWASLALQSLMLAATAAAFGAAFWYARIADAQKDDVIYRQTPKIIESADAAGSAARTAASELSQTIEAFKTDQRPYMVPDGRPNFIKPFDTLDPQVNIAWKDIGKMPAKSVVETGLMVPFRDLIVGQQKRNSERFVEFIQRQFDALGRIGDVEWKDPLGFRQDVAPNATSPFGTLKLSEPLLGDDPRRIRAGEIFLIILGFQRYEGPLGGPPYQSDYCSYFFGSDLDVWHYCPTHNTIR